VRSRSLRIFGIVAAACIVVGIVVTAVFAVLQSHCESSTSNGVTVLVPHSARCHAYGVTAGAGIGVLALGAILVALLPAASAFRSHHGGAPAEAGPGEEAAEEPGEPGRPGGPGVAGETGEGTGDDPPSEHRPEGQSAP
jgi:hypothetical protein